MKCVKNEMNLSFPSHSCNESYARSAVCAFVSPLDPTLEELSDLRTAVSEAVTNAIVHGYRGTVGIVYISVKIYEDRCVRICVRDRGTGIADVAQAMTPFYSQGSDGEGERGGMGFTIMQSFTDRVHVHSVLGKGTSVTMHKRFGGA